MVTQCPILPGSSYTYRFNVTGQEGTLWWHAHVSFLRATVYGALLIRPRPGVPYPFPAPHAEHTLLLGEWWNASATLVDVERQAFLTGGQPANSVALTINGMPGLSHAHKEMHHLRVARGNTIPAPPRQRRAQLPALLQGGRPQLHRRRRGRLLHRPLTHGRHRHRARPDGGRPHARGGRAGAPLLRGRHRCTRASPTPHTAPPPGRSSATTTTPRTPPRQ
ncbi:hypothetical protein OsI_24566 [Oryza sativa Indica Group]|uniref:Plastocyanin-like domain-containing protein n=1 Tax=Oryza sativa subsp. indica TaxID=39946 RepID=B8B6H9_ORYSI|nr:hypothetical protein OsI_24566 [Oryza sativa Indica Group]